MHDLFPRDRWCAIIMAGGLATRLYPASAGVNKHLLPIYDKPVVYYPLTTLMLGGLRDYVVVSTPDAIPQIKNLLGDGQQWGISIDYATQPEPRGIADVFNICAESIAGRNTALILGDNIFYGRGMPETVTVGACVADNGGAMIYAYELGDPRAFGVVELDPSGAILSLEEKPARPRSNLVVPGLYFFDHNAPGIVRDLRPSQRGELEITDLNRHYLDQGKLRVHRLGRGIAWMDGGTPETLFEATNYIRAIEIRQGMKVACPHEIAFRRGFIDLNVFKSGISAMPAGPYRAYLEAIAERA